MEDLELVLLFLLMAVIGLTAIAHALDVPYPILLVIGGSAIGFAPGVPDVQLQPNLVLLVFLPPLLFNLAAFASAPDLRSNMRSISFAALPLVLMTMCAVAIAFHAAVPEMPWAAAFALGAIVSPTDPLAAIQIAQRQGVPRRLVTLIEGESLINDGTALVAYRTAVAAAVGGTFDLLDATGDFVVNVAGGVAVGLVAAAIVVPIFRRIQDDVINVTLSLATGYIAYLPAEQLGVSGVIAAVTVGLVIGQRTHELSGASTRLRGYAFWEVLVFLLNAVLFVLVGLQLPSILNDQDRSAATLAALGALAAFSVVAIRLIFVNTMPYLVRALDRRPSQRDRRVGWRARFVFGWSGLRGSVSLAAALALPLDFPERDLVVFATLCVIFATLVVQGLTLPLVIEWLGVRDPQEEPREELRARKATTRAAIDALEDLRGVDWVREETLDRVIAQYEFRYRRLLQRAGYAEDGEEDLETRSQAYQRVQREVFEAQRRALLRMRDQGEISNTVMHLMEREFDLEDERLVSLGGTPAVERATDPL